MAGLPTIHDQAAQMALRVAERLLQEVALAHPAITLTDAIDLVHDWVLYLGQPTTAVKFALAFHPTVERWGIWDGWAKALACVLQSDPVTWSPSEQIQLLHAHSQAAREMGDMVVARASAEASLALATRIDDPALSVISLTKLGLIALREDNLNQAAGYLDHAARLPLAQVPSRECGNLFLNCGVVATRQGDYAKATEAFRLALQYYDPERDQLLIAKTQCNCADLARRTGELTEVPPALLTAIKLFAELGNQESYGQALNDLGCIELSLGHYAAALEAFERALAVFRKQRQLGAQVWIATNLIELHVTCEHWDAALQLIHEMYPIAVAGDWRLFTAAIDCDWGTLLWRQGDYPGAMAHWCTALETQLAIGATEAARETEQRIVTAGGRCDSEADVTPYRYEEDVDG
jgi:tetratricopeptide (TPR) repeat protein